MLTGISTPTIPSMMKRVRSLEVLSHRVKLLAGSSDEGSTNGKSAMATVSIMLAPGALFSSKGLHNHCLRLNSSHPWSEQLEGALTRLAELIHQQLDAIPPKNNKAP